MMLGLSKYAFFQTWEVFRHLSAPPPLFLWLDDTYVRSFAVVQQILEALFIFGFQSIFPCQIWYFLSFHLKFTNWFFYLFYFWVHLLLVKFIYWILGFSVPKFLFDCSLYLLFLLEIFYFFCWDFLYSMNSCSLKHLYHGCLKTPVDDSNTCIISMLVCADCLLSFKVWLSYFLIWQVIFNCIQDILHLIRIWILFNLLAYHMWVEVHIPTQPPLTPGRVGLLVTEG